MKHEFFSAFIFYSFENIFDDEFDCTVAVRDNGFIIYDKDYKALTVVQTVDGLVGFLDGLRSVRNEA